MSFSNQSKSRRIKRKKTEKILSFAIKFGMVVFITIDLFFQKIVRFFFIPRYRIAGGCKKRGECCRNIFFPWYSRYDKIPFFKAIILWWFTKIYDFYEKQFSYEESDKMRYMVFGCHNLREDGKCGDYFLRPRVCRNYPRETFFQKPVLLKGCGFSIERHPYYQKKEIKK